MEDFIKKDWEQRMQRGESVNDVLTYASEMEADQVVVVTIDEEGNAGYLYSLNNRAEDYARMIGEMTIAKQLLIDSINIIELNE